MRDATTLPSVTRTHNKTNLLVRNCGVETATLDFVGRVLLARKVLHTLQTKNFSSNNIKINATFINMHQYVMLCYVRMLFKFHHIL